MVFAEFRDFLNIGNRYPHLKYGIVSNGSLIHKHIDQIRNANWSFISISLDAATEETFSILRPTKGGKSKFPKIINNMRMLAETKKGTLGFSYLIQTEADGPTVVSNIHEIYDAAVLAKDIGCDYFEVKPTYQWRDGVDHALMKHDQKLMDEAKVQVAALEELEDEKFKIFRAITLEYSLNGSDLEQKKEYRNK